MRQFFEAGVHFGHQTALEPEDEALHLRCLRNGIHITICAHRAAI